GLFSLRAVIFQGGLHQCPSEKGAKASRLLARTSHSLVSSRLTLPAKAGSLRGQARKAPVRETRRRREQDSNPRSPDRQDGFRSPQNRRSHGKARPPRRPAALNLTLRRL